MKCVASCEVPGMRDEAVVKRIGSPAAAELMSHCSSKNSQTCAWWEAVRLALNSQEICGLDVDDTFSR